MENPDCLYGIPVETRLTGQVFVCEYVFVCGHVYVLMRECVRVFARACVYVPRLRICIRVCPDFYMCMHVRSSACMSVYTHARA